MIVPMRYATQTGVFSGCLATPWSTIYKDFGSSGFDVGCDDGGLETSIYSDHDDEGIKIAASRAHCDGTDLPCDFHTRSSYFPSREYRVSQLVGWYCFCTLRNHRRQPVSIRRWIQAEVFCRHSQEESYPRLADRTGALLPQSLIEFRQLRHTRQRRCRDEESDGEKARRFLCRQSITGSADFAIILASTTRRARCW